ncbi:MAG: hypothetical protein IIZ78_00635 [Clostridiales bacterium]|nr:hypothetical protein [Clostridiales bacterium]
MAFKIDDNVLVEGPLTQVDNAPRYPLGYKVTDDCGREYVYVKASANLTAGTAVALAGFTALSTSSVKAGGAVASSATPSTTNYKDLIGNAVVISGGTKIYPIVDADGTFLVIPGIAATDTISSFIGYPYAIAGGAASATATNALPVVSMASGKYGFVALAAPVAAS